MVNSFYFAGWEEPYADSPPSLLRRDHNSGKKRLLRVAVRYFTPLDPPVPMRDPIMRSTMATCR